MAGRDAIKRAFDEYFAGYGLSLPVEYLVMTTGEFEQNGSDVHCAFVVADDEVRRRGHL